MRVQTQWNISPMGQRIGLNYPGVRAAAKMAGVKIDPDMFAGLQIMEYQVLKDSR